MNQTTRKIISLLKQYSELRPADLAAKLAVSRVYVQRQLAEMLKTGSVIKTGAPPKVYYRLKPQHKLKTGLPINLQEFIEQNYLYVTPVGELEYGVAGFLDWAKRSKQKEAVMNLAERYRASRVAADKYIGPDGLIQAKQKLHSIFGNDLALDAVCYSDFYALPQFGKTRLGTLMLTAKQAQSLSLTKLIVSDIRSAIMHIIKDQQITRLAYIPPSIARNKQFMAMLQRLLNLDFQLVDLKKYYASGINIPQKSLKTLAERIENASQTIIFDQQQDQQIAGQNILLIDDALGSGATLNEVAKKLKAANAKQVFGYAITGSYKGFEVLQEV